MHIMLITVMTTVVLVIARLFGPPVRDYVRACRTPESGED